MKVIGDYDTDGNFSAYAKPVEVVQHGNQLMETDSGMIWAVKDEYGDWVNPNLLRLQVKSIIKVE